MTSRRRKKNVKIPVAANVDPSLYSRLNTHISATGNTKTFIIEEALTMYLDQMMTSSHTTTLHIDTVVVQAANKASSKYGGGMWSAATMLEKIWHKASRIGLEAVIGERVPQIACLPRDHRFSEDGVARDVHVPHKILNKLKADYGYNEEDWAKGITSALKDYYRGGR